MMDVLTGMFVRTSWTRVQYDLIRPSLDGNLVLVPLVSRGVEENDARVHAGFLISYNSVRSTVLSTVRAQLEAFPGYAVVLAGMYHPND